MSFKKALSAFMVLATLLATVNVPANDVYSLSKEETLSKGYQIIDGDVYDKYGTLLIDMEDGRLPNGYTLALDFSVAYPEEASNKRISTLLRKTEIWNGTKSLKENTSGSQDTKLGNSFKLTSSDQTVYIEYTSGQIDVNFSLDNDTTGQCVKWWSATEAPFADDYTAYNSNRAGDEFSVKASGQNGGGNCTLKVVID